jgi:hypothetical protein
MVDGITAVRVICHSLAPVTARALERIEEHQEHDHDPGCHDLRGITDPERQNDDRRQRDARDGIHGGNDGLEDVTEPVRPSQQQTRRETRRHADDNPKNLFFSLIAVATQRLFSFRTMHLAKSPLNQPLKAPSWISGSSGSGSARRFLTVSTRNRDRADPEPATEIGHVDWSKDKNVVDHVFLRASDVWGPSHQKRPLDEASGRAGIAPAVTFHILRHTHGSHLAMAGVPMGVIAAQLGHADTRMTEKHYAHLAPSYVAQTIRANFPVLNLSEEPQVVPLRKRLSVKSTLRKNLRPPRPERTSLL